MDKKVWLIPLSIILFIGYKKLNIAKRFSIKFKGFDFTTLSFLNPVLTLQIIVNNPTDATAEVQNIIGDLKFNNQYVGSVKGIKTTIINNGDTIIDIPISLDNAGVFKILRELKIGAFKFEFYGTIVIDNITLPLNFTY